MTNKQLREEFEKRFIKSEWQKKPIGKSDSVVLGVRREWKGNPIEALDFIDQAISNTRKEVLGEVEKEVKAVYKIYIAGDSKNPHDLLVDILQTLKQK